MIIISGLSIDDIDIYEINEAFASQATYCVEKLGIPMQKVKYVYYSDVRIQGFFGLIQI